MYSKSMKGNRSHAKSRNVKALYVIILSLAAIAFYEFTSLSNTSTLLKESSSLLKKKNDELSKLKEEYEMKKNELTKKLEDVFEERDSANQNRQELELKLRGSVQDKKDALAKKTKKLQDKISLAEERIERLTTDLQHHGKHAVLEKYGDGPIRVEFKIEFHPDEIPPGTGDSFIAELAPVDLMPYTVNFFLEQVSRGLLNGCSFHRNAGHVVQGGPVKNHLSTDATNLRKGFRDADLVSVAFQEYHADFPHKKYTMGYAGRPGGPDFYISTVDNTKNHGPGGQESYAVKSEADPCFAKVVEGFDTVDRMRKLSVEPGGYKRLNHNVAIKSVTILNQEIQSTA